VLAADTLVFLDGAVLGKPRDDEESREMLARSPAASTASSRP
jgi:predicted house-cleaning NTP pyrophosphatase (Maf/HAM1 superfamily)